MMRADLRILPGRKCGLMDRFHILHRTVYRYNAPVRFGMHRLVLRPREGHEITVVKHQLTTVPQARLFWLNDLYGNNVALAEFDEESDQLEIRNEVLIDRVPRSEDAAPLRSSHSSEAPLPVNYPQMELPVAQGYIASVYPADQAKVAAWVAGLPPPEELHPTALEMVEHLGRCIYKQIKYRRREEPGVQTPTGTLDLGTGSCRDMAVLMMEGCRAMGIATRFVSGYLNASASAAGRGATHAWADVYLPDRGWTGYDPTIGERVSRKHIPIGVSAHPRGVMPVSGIFNGPPGAYEGMEVAVSMKQVPVEEMEMADTK
jgi:transglutaminase-like putative cysteine protease